MSKLLIILLLFVKLIICNDNTDEIQSVSVGPDGSIELSEDQEYRTVSGPPPQQYWVTFVNEADEPIELYYDDGRDGILQGKMDNKGDELKIGTYVGHQFYYRRPNKKHRMFITTMETGKIRVPFKDPEIQKQEEIELKKSKEKFIKEYQQNNSIPWLHTYPRPKPILKFLPFNNVNDTITIQTQHGYYTCYPKTLKKIDIDKCYKDKQILTFEWKVLSVKPKILQLNNFLSDYEVEHIKNLAKPKLEPSVTGAGGYTNNARTSSTAWVKRSESDLLDHIFKRIADVTLVDEEHLWDTIGSESIQVVYYEKGQEYKAHHDWRNNRIQTRFATFLMYLNNQFDKDSGGETSFPKINMKVHPGKGNVIMFYDLMEDGNVDDLTLHAALPVIKGVKWLSNVWIWDPNFS